MKSNGNLPRKLYTLKIPVTRLAFTKERIDAILVASNRRDSFGRKPTRHQLAAEFETTAVQISSILRTGAPVRQNKDEKNLKNSQLTMSDSLTRRRAVADYFEGMTGREVAEKYGVTENFACYWAKRV